MEDLRIAIKVVADGAEVGRGMSLAAASVTSFERTTTKALDRVKGSFAGLSTSTKLLGGLGLGLGALALGLSQSIGPAIEFESAFAGVLKTVNGSTAQLNDIRIGLIELSTVMPTSASDLAAIAENAGQLGVAAPKVLEFTEVVAQLGETTDLDFEAAAQSLARFLNVTGNQASITQLGDVIVELGNNSATTESQILTFAQRLASAFSIAGATEDQILAIGAAFSSLGVEAEAGSSALNRVITQISDAAILGGQDLQQFADVAGILPEEFANIARSNPVEALLLFGEGLASVTEEGRSISPILESLELDGIRTTRVMQLLALGADDIRVSLGLAADQMIEGGAAAEEFARRSETTASRLALLQNRINAVAIAAGTPLLSGIAIGADEAGDAIVQLIEALGPITSQLPAAFGVLADSASLFFRVIGGPSLALAAAGLNGLIVTVSNLLGVFNALGPAGVIFGALLVDLIRVGPITARAVLAIDGLAASVFTLGVRGTAASAALKGLQAVLSAGPLIAITAIGAAFFDASRKGEEFADVYSRTISNALQQNDFADVVGTIQALTAEQERLQSVVGDSVAFQVGAVSVRDFGGALDTARGFLPGFGSDVSDNEAKLKALNDQLGEMGLGTFEDDINRASNALGLSQDSILQTASQLGVLEQLIGGTNDEWFNAVDAIDQATQAERDLANETGILADKILNGTASLEEYQAALGLTADELAFLVNQIDGVELDDFLTQDPQKVRDAFDAIEGLERKYADLADQIGISSAEFKAQLSNVEALAAAHSSLRQAIEGTLSAYQLLDEQQRITNTATEEFAEALAGIDGTDESLNLAAQAMQTLSAESAGLAGTAEQAALNQEKLYSEFRLTALEAGKTEEEIIRAAVAYGLLNEASLATIVSEGQKLRLENELLEQSLRDLVEDEYNIELGADDNASDVILGVINTAEDYKAAAYRAAIEADDEASDVIAGIQSSADQYKSAQYLATVEADDVASDVFGFVQSLADEYKAGEYNASVTASDDGASVEIGVIQDLVDAYKLEAYNASLTASDDGASSTIGVQQSLADDYKNGVYLASLTADNSDAVRDTRIAQGTVDAYKSGAYQANLNASWQGQSAVDRAKREVRSVTGKTVTITAFYRRVGQPFADGGFSFENGGIASYDTGGMQGLGAQAQLSLPNGAVRETPGPAKIYAPATPGRFFAEPVTGGEAYIPLASAKRSTAVPVWIETGRILGMLAASGVQAFNNGGISVGRQPHPPRPISVQSGGPQITLAASIDLTINPTPEMDTTQLARLAGNEARKALDDAARDLRNMRIG